jgi:4-amino-4-deoxy-L-arabinose transferase-like glycosyltransferase
MEILVRARKEETPWSLTAFKIAGLFAIMALAAFFRLYRIAGLPPGDGHDPAFYGVDALRILRGARPIFFLTNFGREAMFSYLVAGFIKLLGPSALAIHVASAAVGILTVPAVYLVGEELFAGEREPLRSFGGLVAALVMSISYWHLNWSRYGVRAVLVPLFVALTFYFLWRGFRTGRWWTFVACGLALGLSLYTYQAARLLPVLIFLGFLYRVGLRRGLTRRDGRNFITVVIVSLVVFAPLGHYFVTHPGSFSARIRQVLVPIGDPPRSSGAGWDVLGERLVRTLAIFGVRGDTEPYSTIPHRPALHPFLSLLLLSGIVLSFSRRKKPSSLFFLTNLAVMLTPAVFAEGGAMAKRAIGALPVVALLIAVGSLGPWPALQRWSRKWREGCRVGINVTYIGFIVGGFIYSGLVTYRDYFVTWALDPDLFTHFEVGTSAIGKYIGTLPPDERIYVSPDLPTHPGIVFHSGLREGVRGYNGRVCFVAPAWTESPTTYVIVPSKDREGLDRLRTYYPQGQMVYDGPLHYDQPYFRAYRVPENVEARISPEHPASVRWTEHIQFLGYDLNASAYQPGDVIGVMLYCQGLAPMDHRYTVFVHLLGPTNPATGGPLWAQDDSEPCRTFYPTSAWDAGEIIVDWFTLVLPDDIPPGTYTLSMGFYDLSTMERLPVTYGSSQDSAATLGAVRISPCLQKRP